MMLSVNNIRIGYKNGEMVLDDLGFTLEPGQILAVLGPNGAGKTTLLRCINAMIKPWTGTVEIGGVSVFQMDTAEIARHLGYVPQRNDVGRITVFDAVLLGRKPHFHWRIRPVDLAKTSGALRRLGLEHLALRHIDQLSGGELQKVCIARTLVQEPGVMLLDEPTSSLDLKNQIDILDNLRQVVIEHRIGAVMTLHDINSALRFADRFLFLKKGKVFAMAGQDDISEDIVSQVYGIQVDIIRHGG
ncbi:MAG: ABC transporter ATP-binding protein, partial [Desulfamplus sp.]|nr:ABC transporter ATP-binding protein [Desulfamplus sp.]